MAVQVDVDVTVTGVKWDDGGFYTGDFKYKQTNPKSPKFIDQSGNINGKETLEELNVILNWKSNTVKIQGNDYDAGFLHPHNKSIRLLKSFGGKPSNEAPAGGGVITVPGGNGTSSLTIKDKNNDGEIYTYNLVAEIDIDGGKPLIDDPIIINQDPPDIMMRRAQPATAADPGEPGEAADPATPAVPPEPAERG